MTLLPATFTPDMLARLKKEYAKVNSIDPEGEDYKKLCSVLDACDLDNLKVLAASDIPFVSGLARNRVYWRTNKAKHSLN